MNTCVCMEVQTLSYHPPSYNGRFFRLYVCRSHWIWA